MIQLFLPHAGAEAALALGGPCGLGGHCSAHRGGSEAAAPAVGSAAAGAAGGSAAPLVAGFHPGRPSGASSAIPEGPCRLRAGPSSARGAAVGAEATQGNNSTAEGRQFD
jgi:hypothetical protein